MFAYRCLHLIYIHWIFHPVRCGDFIRNSYSERSLLENLNFCCIFHHPRSQRWSLRVYTMLVQHCNLIRPAVRWPKSRLSRMAAGTCVLRPVLWLSRSVSLSSCWPVGMSVCSHRCLAYKARHRDQFLPRRCGQILVSVAMLGQRDNVS